MFISALLAVAVAVGQAFAAIPSSGVYTIQSVQPGLYMTLGNRTEPGTAIIGVASSGSARSRWDIAQVYRPHGVSSWAIYTFAADDEDQTFAYANPIADSSVEAQPFAATFNVSEGPQEGQLRITIPTTRGQAESGVVTRITSPTIGQTEFGLVSPNTNGGSLTVANANAGFATHRWWFNKLQ